MPQLQSITVIGAAYTPPTASTYKQRFQSVQIMPPSSTLSSKPQAFAETRPQSETMKRSPSTGTRTVIDRRRPYSTGDTPALDSPQFMQLAQPTHPPKLNNLVLVHLNPDLTGSPTSNQVLSPPIHTPIPLVEGKIDYCLRDGVQPVIAPPSNSSLSPTGLQPHGPPHALHPLATSCQRLNKGLMPDHKPVGTIPSLSSLETIRASQEYPPMHSIRSSSSAPNLEEHKDHRPPSGVPSLSSVGSLKAMPPPDVCDSPVHKRVVNFGNLPPALLNIPSSNPSTASSPRKEKGEAQDASSSASPQQTPPRRQTPSQIRKTTRVRLNKVKVLGKGSWGTVFVGLNEATRELIAVKEVTFTTNEEVEQSAREIRVMKNLDHPSIVKYLGAERDENTLKIYMEYIVGGSLASLLKTYGVLTELMAQGYCIQVLEGLEYLHSKNIAHRDIKCDNLLVEKNGDVKLADFGQSKDASEILKTVTGTAYFMAPEVIKGEEYTLMADIWSFGCAVIEMLCGRPPFSHYENQWAAMYHITNGDPAAQIPDSCSARAKDFLGCCLQREPQQRWPAARMLRHPFLAQRNESIDAIRQSATALQLGMHPSPFDTPPQSPPQDLSPRSSARGSARAVVVEPVSVAPAKNSPSSPLSGPQPSPPVTPSGSGYRRHMDFQFSDRVGEAKATGRQEVSGSPSRADLEENSKSAGQLRHKSSFKKKGDPTSQSMKQGARAPAPQGECAPAAGPDRTYNDVISKLQEISQGKFEQIPMVPDTKNAHMFSPPDTPNTNAGPEKRRKEKRATRQLDSDGVKGAAPVDKSPVLDVDAPMMFPAPVESQAEEFPTDVISPGRMRPHREVVHAIHDHQNWDDRMNTPPTGDHVPPVIAGRIPEPEGPPPPGRVRAKSTTPNGTVRARVSPAKLRGDLLGEGKDVKPRIDLERQHSAGSNMAELARGDAGPSQERQGAKDPAGENPPLQRETSRKALKKGLNADRGDGVPVQPPPRLRKGSPETDRKKRTRAENRAEGGGPDPPVTSPTDLVTSPTDPPVTSDPPAAGPADPPLSPGDSPRQRLSAGKPHNPCIDSDVCMLPPPSAPSPEASAILEEESPSLMVSPAPTKPNACGEEAGSRPNVSPNASAHLTLGGGSFEDIENLNPMQSFGAESESLPRGAFARISA